MAETLAVGSCGVNYVIGHIVLKHQGVLFRRTSPLSSSTDVDDEEYEASRFASYAAMPTHLLRTCTSAEDVEVKFQVSATAARIRWRDYERLNRESAGNVKALPQFSYDILRAKYNNGERLQSIDRAKKGHQTWLKHVLPKHQKLSELLPPLVRALLDKAGVRYRLVEARPKDLTSAVTKIERKGYSDPERQLTDLTGIRIVTRSLSEAKKVDVIIRSTFRIDEKNSVGRLYFRDLQKVGYRSAHFVCSLASAQIVEHRIDHELATLRFEVQVRSYCEHLWAELSHEILYKSETDPPHACIRNLFLLAALLEVCDNDIDEIERQINEDQEVED